jgi:hypothetical protein
MLSPIGGKRLSKPSGNDITLVPITLRPAPVHIGAHVGVTDLMLILPGKISIGIGENFSMTALNRLLTLLENR